MAVAMRVKVLGADIAESYLRAVAAGIPRSMVRGVLGASIALQKELRLHVSGKTLGGPSRTSGNQLNPFAGSSNNKGNFARSWQIGAPDVGPQTVTGSVGSNHPGARIHEEGGTIRPKNAKSLAIPISPMARNRRPREFPAEKTAVVKTARGTFIVLNEGRRTTFLYILKKSVRMPARHYITRAIHDATPEMEKFLGAGVDAALEGGRA